MAMTVQCTSCSTSFPVDPAKVPPGGVRARCSACGSIFRVERPSEPSEPAPRAVEPEDDGGLSSFFGGSSAVEDREEAPGTAEEPSASAGGGFGGGEPASPAPGAGAGAGGFGSGQETSPPTTAAGSDAVGGAAVDDWVLEREPEVDASEIDVQRLDTVEEGMRSAQDALGGPAPGESPAPGAPEAGGAGTTFSPEPPPPAGGAPGEAGAGGAPSAPVQGFTFGKRDPKEKASRLARVLVSDMVAYNRDRHQRALDQGTLKEDFEDEIKKSWDEYVDQVGKDVAESTTFFNDALNEILARGQRVF